MRSGKFSISNFQYDMISHYSNSFIVYSLGILTNCGKMVLNRQRLIKLVKYRKVKTLRLNNVEKIKK